MARIFLSHSSKNNAAAIALRDWIIKGGWDEHPFLDLNPERGIAAGERWERALHEAADRCEAVLFLISRDWLNSDWCLKEFNLAQKLNKRLFGVLIDDLQLSALPASLKSVWQAVNLASGSDHILFRAKLPDLSKEEHVTFSASGLARLKVGLDPRFFAWPPDSQPDRSPYPGLRPLEAEDAGIFFGREAPTIVVLDRLRGLREAAAPRLLVILGASGSGKSSFLRASLIPRLGRDDANFLPLPVLRPEMGVITGKSGLIQSLQDALRAMGLSLNRADIANKVSAGAATLIPLLNELAKKARAPELAGETQPLPPSLVLSIDQGEELFFAEPPEEADTFLMLLKDLVYARTLNLIVIFTIRSDSYERLQTALEGIRVEIFGLPTMPRGAYQIIIEGPAKRMSESKRNLEIDPALTEAILADVEKGSGKDALALLAFTLERLYREYGADGDLLLKEYDALGRIKGSIQAGVESALKAADADRTIPKDRAARLALLRRALIPALARIDPETGESRRRVARMSEIPAEAHGLIKCLVAARLLVTDSAQVGGETVIEPAHEALLRQWSDLQDWLTDDSDALIVLESVQQAAAEWERQEHKEEYLWPQKRMLQAHKMVERLRPQLNQVEMRFLLLHDENELIQELAILSTPHQRRAAIGDRLAEIGDNRMGVGLSADGVPAPLWCEIPAAEISLDEDAGKFSVQPFQMAKYPVTWGQYRSFLTAADGHANPAWWERLVRYEIPGDTALPINHPAVNVSWYDAMAFCRWLSTKLGYEVRLPAEWEWEAAATGGNPTRAFAWGTDWDPSKANTEESGNNRSTAVGMYPHGASPLGILDLSGNVWEWCVNNYDSPAALPEAEDRAKVVRGGSWMWKHDYARVTRRDRDQPGYRSGNHGFRLACSKRWHPHLARRVPRAPLQAIPQARKQSAERDSRPSKGAPEGGNRGENRAVLVGRQLPIFMQSSITSRIAGLAPAFGRL